MSEWLGFAKSGRFTGSPDDQSDGFIHLSTGPQLAGTLKRHFAGTGLAVLAEIEASGLGGALRYEPSRDGALFPHLYADLKSASVGRAARLQESDRRFMVPDWVEGQG
jgi:uncharacterized protein (DUF952 family)